MIHEHSEGGCLKRTSVLLEVVVEVGVRNGDKVSGVGEVEKSVVVVLVVVQVGREVDVVDPYVGGNLDGNGIAADDFLDRD